MNDRDPLLKAIDAIRAKPGLVPEADALLKLAAESAQGKPLAEIVAELPNNGPAMLWQPIATAPKDGTDVLAWMHEQVVVARWDDQRFYSRPQPFWKSWGPRGSCADRGSQPLWWMPLPSAPPRV